METSNALHCALAPSLCSQRGQEVTSDDTWPFWLKKKRISHRNTVMETKGPHFVSTIFVLLANFAV